MPAIRTVGETDDVHVIEGLGIPFGGPFPGDSDSYGTRATAKTNFFWDLFPDRSPDDPPEIAARFVRPNTYQHGFDEAVGLSRVGGWSPVRIDKRGVWVQAQLDKHHAYYSAIRELLDKDALGFSPASVEHAVRFGKNGEWLDWPMFEIALTPTPSNPWAQIAARTAEFVQVTGVRATDKKGKAVGPPEGGKARDEIPAEDFAGKDKSFPIVTPSSVSDAAASIGRAGDDNYSTDELKGRIIAIAKRKGAAFVAALPDAWKDDARSAFRGASDDAAFAMHIKEEIVSLMGCEADEPDQLKSLQAALDAMGDFVHAEVAEIGSPDEDDEPAPMPPLMGAFMSAIREGRRNRGTDLALIDGIHDATVALGASAHAGDEPPTDQSHQEPDGARSATALRKTQRARDRAIRKALRKAARTGSRLGADIGQSEALRLVRPMT